MLKSKHIFRGDTLIEVTIAIGIFALVAISVVAVVSASTTGAQFALENTLTREEVDAQAETIRFLQSIIDSGEAITEDEIPDTKDGLYQAMWLRIKRLAEDNNKYGINNTISSFGPSTCSAAYEEDSDELENAFVIDLKKLDSYAEGQDVDAYAKEVVLSAKENPDLFVPASTYPQLVYTQPGNNSFILKGVEGIYVVGVRDPTKTNIVEQNAETGEVSVQSTEAYYDFYVRSCWYNSGSENASSVSTAVRVHDPDAIAHVATPQPPKESSSETITFDNITWKTYGDRVYQGCGGCYEPWAGEHVSFPDETSIRLLGSTASNVSGLGAYYDKFNVNDPFSLQVNIDASNIGTHPSEYGGFTVRLDIVDENGKTVVPGINASITSSLSNSGIHIDKTVFIPGTSEAINASSQVFSLLLEYSRGRFTGCITESGGKPDCISATKQIPVDSFLKVSFELKHGSHCCCMNAHVELSDIKMYRSSTGTITFDM